MDEQSTQHDGCIRDVVAFLLRVTNYGIRSIPHDPSSGPDSPKWIVFKRGAEFSPEYQPGATFTPVEIDPFSQSDNQLRKWARSRGFDPGKSGGRFLMDRPRVPNISVSDMIKERVEHVNKIAELEKEVARLKMELEEENT
jgi:hypothetical protein